MIDLEITLVMFEKNMNMILFLVPKLRIIIKNISESLYNFDDVLPIKSPTIYM